jgi:hypothetical protein
MSLPQKDCKVHFDADVYAAIEVIAEIEGMPVKHWIEGIVEKEAARRVHAAKVVAHRAGAAGTSWIDRVLLGIAQ